MAYRKVVKVVKAKHVPVMELTEDTKRVLSDMLRSKNKNNGDIIELEELGEFLETLGFSPQQEDVEFLRTHLDDNQDGHLEIEELMNNIDVINYHCYYGKELMYEFNQIDADGDGVIRYPEMLHVLTTRGPNPLPVKEARKLLDQLAREFDTNFDGKFNYSEFVKIYMSDMLPYKNEMGRRIVTSQETDDMEARAKAALSARKSMKKKASMKTRSKPMSQSFRGTDDDDEVGVLLYAKGRERGQVTK